MKVLVTGGAGFVGRALVNRLACADHFDAVAVVRERDSELPGDAVQRVMGNLGPSTDWSEALCGVDAVVHLAARVHVTHEQSHARFVEYRRINTDATLRLAEQAATAGCRRLIFVSSIKVNGDTTQIGKPFSEADPELGTDPYAVSKAEAEAGLFALGRECGLEIVVVRPPLVYGSGARANFRALARAVTRGIPLPLGAVTANRRSFISIDNLTDFIITCLTHPAAAGEVFLVSDDEDVSTAELVRRLAAAAGTRPRLFSVPVHLLRLAAKISGNGAAAATLLGNLQIDPSKAARVLGWRPPMGLDEGLRRAVGRQ